MGDLKRTIAQNLRMKNQKKSQKNQKKERKHRQKQCHKNNNKQKRQSQQLIYWEICLVHHLRHLNLFSNRIQTRIMVAVMTCLAIYLVADHRNHSKTIVTMDRHWLLHLILIKDKEWK